MSFNTEQIKYWDMEIRKLELKLECIDHQIKDVPVNSDTWDVFFQLREKILSDLQSVRKQASYIRSSVR